MATILPKVASKGIPKPQAKAGPKPKPAAPAAPAITTAEPSSITEDHFMSVNKVILLGRLGGNPELRYTPGGAPVCNFSIATNEKWTDKSGQKQEKTEWHHIVVWGKSAESCNECLHKGSQVYVEGKLTTRQWQDKEGQARQSTEVQAISVQFVDRRPRDDGGAGA